MADDSVHPVPCVLVLSTRGRRSSNESCAVTTTSTDSDPGRWPPFTSTDARPARQDPPGCRAHVIDGGDPHPGQGLRLRDVRRQDARVRQQLALDRLDRVLFEQPVTALRHHHGIDDDVGKVQLHNRGGDRLDNGGGCASMPILTARRSKSAATASICA